MYSDNHQNMLEIAKQKISRSSLVLGIAYILIGIVVLVATILFYLGFFAIYNLEIWDFYFVSLVLVLLIYMFLVVFKSIYFFKLSRGYDYLASEFSSVENLQTSATKDVSKYIKIGVISELVLTFLFPLAIFAVFLLPFFLSIFLVPFIFLTLGFMEIKRLFSLLSKHQFYNGEFTNLILYSRTGVVAAFFLYAYGGVKFLEEMITEAFTGTFNDSFLIWILIAGIILFISQVLLAKGFYNLSKETHNITI
ncbi:MAG: hypothetical protein ACTSRR_12640 [Candidatus Heimdallarchaeaceae archaeon]